jgi:hypothetical protein
MATVRGEVLTPIVCDAYIVFDGLTGLAPVELPREG